MKGQTMTVTYQTDSNWPDIVKVVHVTDNDGTYATTGEATEDDPMALVATANIARNRAMFLLAGATAELCDTLAAVGHRKTTDVLTRYRHRIGAAGPLDTTVLAGKLGARKMGDPDRPAILLGIELEDGTVVHTDSYRIFTQAAIGSHSKWKVPPARGAAFAAEDVIPPALLGTFAHVCDRHGDGWGSIRTMDADQLYTLATLAQDMGHAGDLEKASAMKLAYLLDMLRNAAMATPPTVASFMADPIGGHHTVTFSHTEAHHDQERVVFRGELGNTITVAGPIMANLRADLVWTQANDTPLGPIQGRTEDGTVVAVVMPIRDGGSYDVTPDMHADAAVLLANDTDALPASVAGKLDGPALRTCLAVVRGAVAAARQTIGEHADAVRNLEDGKLDR